jgi:hypothetical protein
MGITGRSDVLLTLGTPDFKSKCSKTQLFPEQNGVVSMQ